jgi:hypothetical protein
MHQCPAPQVTEHDGSGLTFSEFLDHKQRCLRSILHLTFDQNPRAGFNPNGTIPNLKRWHLLNAFGFVWLIVLQP